MTLDGAMTESFYQFLLYTYLIYKESYANSNY